MRLLTIVCLALIGLMAVGPANLATAQQPGGQRPMPGQPAPGGQPPMMGPGMPGPGMPGTHQMMGGHTDQCGTGMMGGGPMDPKAMGRMLQMRGEMCKAMGEIMIKYGKMMEEGK